MKKEEDKEHEDQSTDAQIGQVDYFEMISEMRL